MNDITLMDNISSEEKRFQFYGEGGELFKIFIVNALLTFITLGIYYPWAKASLKQYLYEETEFAGNRFQFHGTGKEMFIGMLKSVLFFVAVMTIGTLISSFVHPVAGIAFIYLSIIAVIPFAIVSSLKYNYSRSSWRGIHFGYRGTAANMAKEFYVGLLLTVLTLGIYSAWYSVKLQKEIQSNSRFGDVEFEFTGSGSELFGKIIVGYILTILTLGIYGFWLRADLYNYYNHHTNIKHNGNEARLNSTITGGGLFGLEIVNLLLIVFTLGFATPWVVVRSLTYLHENLSVVGALDLATIKQTERPYNNATGESILDNLEISVG
jgi:uncharacterized membrane protein YjgN (DUF898 family)